MDMELDWDLDLGLDLCNTLSTDSGAHHWIFHTCFLNSFLLHLDGGGLSIKSIPVDWNASDLFFFLPSRQLIQVSVLHQFLQIFFTFNLSRWCMWVINTIILVAGAHVLFWSRNPVIKLSGLQESDRKTQDTNASTKQTGRLKAPRKTLRRIGRKWAACSRQRREAGK